jgi:hypothetical protein
MTTNTVIDPTIPKNMLNLWAISLLSSARTAGVNTTVGYAVILGPSRKSIILHQRAINAIVSAESQITEV